MRIMSKLYSWKKYFTEEDLPFQAMIHRQIYQVIHHHEFLELVIVLNGKGTHYFAGRFFHQRTDIVAAVDSHIETGCRISRYGNGRRSF